MLCFLQPHKSQSGFNTPKSCSSAWELHLTVFLPLSPSIAALLPGPVIRAGTKSRSPSHSTTSDCDHQILSSGSFTSPTAFCWQVVLPGNTQWGEEANVQPAVSATLQTGVWVPLQAPPAQHHAALLPVQGPEDDSATSSCPTMATALGLSALYCVASGCWFFLPRLLGSHRTYLC